MLQELQQHTPLQRGVGLVIALSGYSSGNKLRNTGVTESVFLVRVNRNECLNRSSQDNGLRTSWPCSDMR
jgi:hypothetical protein